MSPLVAGTMPAKCPRTTRCASRGVHSAGEEPRGMDAAAEFPRQAWMPLPRARAKTMRSRSEFACRSGRGCRGASTMRAGGFGGTSPKNCWAAGCNAQTL